MLVKAVFVADEIGLIFSNLECCKKIVVQLDFSKGQPNSRLTKKSKKRRGKPAIASIPNNN